MQFEVHMLMIVNYYTKTFILFANVLIFIFNNMPLPKFAPNIDNLQKIIARLFKVDSVSIDFYQERTAGRTVIATCGSGTHLRIRRDGTVSSIF